MDYSTHPQSARILIISHDVIGTHMAGPGIRYWEMAHVLVAYHPVTLIAPQPINQQSSSFVCGSYSWGNPASLAQWLNNADIVVANGMLLQGHPELAQIKQPLALDLYDPVMLENLELFRDAPFDQRMHRTQQDAALLQQQLAAGDFFLCATERQRDLYIGALMVSGRITPDLVDDNAQLRNLIDVVSFGLPAEPPVKQRPVLRGVIPGIGVDDTVLLWTGGLWDWMDPLTLVRAMPQVVAQCPHVRLVFLAGQHPGNAHPMRAPQAARELAQALGLLDRHIFFYEHWVPYAQRADFLLEADIAISLHRDHLETAYAAIRSRFLDHLWAGLPSVLSAGDAAAALFQQAGAALVIETGNSHQLTETILYLLNHPEKQHAQRQAARELAQAFTWAKVLKPLIWFCQSPHRIESQGEPIHTNMMSENPSKTQPEALYPEATALQPEQILFAARDSATAVVEQTWRLHEQPIAPIGIRGRIRQFVIKQFVRPFVMPIVEQQQTHNTALLRSLYTFAEITDCLRRRLDEARTRLNHAHARLDEAHARLDHAHARLDETHARLNHAHARLDDFAKGLKDFHADFNVAYGKVELAHARLDGLDVGIQGLNEQVLHQRHLVSQFVNEIAEQFAGLEETNNQVQEWLLSFDSYKPSANISSDIQE